MLKDTHHSEETKLKMSKAQKGNHNALDYKHTEEARRRISEAHKGKKLSEESKQKVSKACKGRKLSEEHKRKISIAQKGKKYSEETKKKLSEALKGKLFSEERKRKMSGDKNWNWKGGSSFEPYTVDWTDDLKESIRKRDNYICQLCGIHQDELVGRFFKLDIHHIDYKKDNLNPENLITLCRKCHIKTNFNRDYWKIFFNEKPQTKLP